MENGPRNLNVEFKRHVKSPHVFLEYGIGVVLLKFARIRQLNAVIAIQQFLERNVIIVLLKFAIELLKFSRNGQPNESIEIPQKGLNI